MIFASPRRGGTGILLPRQDKTKRTLAFLLALLTVVLCGAAAFAEAEQQPEATADPMGVQQVDISDGSATVKKPEETASPDDLQLELEAPIDGYASFRPTSFEQICGIGVLITSKTQTMNFHSVIISPAWTRITRCCGWT